VCRSPGRLATSAVDAPGSSVPSIPAAALAPEQRKGLHYNGIGPGDSYVGTWVLLNFYRRKLTDTLKALTNEKTTPEVRREHLETQRWCLDHIEGLYKMLLPHEKARLQSITLTGDPSSPVYHEVDLKGLPTEDLKALARILPKLGGAAAEPVPAKPTGGRKHL
jgi:hypothetical protein